MICTSTEEPDDGLELSDPEHLSVYNHFQNSGSYRYTSNVTSY